MREVLAKVALGQADAGFVYSTDAQTVPGKVTVIKVPAWAQPKVHVRDRRRLEEPEQGGRQAFVNEVLSKAGQAEDAGRYGFLPRVKQKRGMSRVAGLRWARLSSLRCSRGRARASSLLPIVALFTHVPPGSSIDQLSNPVVTDALVVSLKTTLVAQALDPPVRDAARVPARHAALPRARGRW